MSNAEHTKSLASGTRPGRDRPRIEQPAGRVVRPTGRLHTGPSTHRLQREALDRRHRRTRATDRMARRAGPAGQAVHQQFAAHRVRRLRHGPAPQRGDVSELQPGHPGMSFQRSAPAHPSRPSTGHVEPPTAPAAGASETPDGGIPIRAPKEIPVSNPTHHTRTVALTPRPGLTSQPDQQPVTSMPRGRRRALPGPVICGAVVGAIQAVSPLGFWWLEPKTPTRSG